MKKRMLAALLCLAMVISCVPSFVFQAQAEGPSVYYDGSPATSVSLPRNQHITLSVDGATQWQIQVPGDFWVDISGKTGSTLEVSYALIASLCSGSTANLRAKTTVNGEPVYSKTIAVNVTDPVEAPSAAADSEYVIQSAPQVVVHDYSPAAAAANDIPADDTAEDTGSVDVAGAEKKVNAAKIALDAAVEQLNTLNSQLPAVREAYDTAVTEANTKKATWETAQANAGAAYQAWQASKTEVEVTPAETTVDEEGNTVIQEAVTAEVYDAALETAYNEAKAAAATAEAEYNTAATAQQAAEEALADINSKISAAQTSYDSAKAEYDAACAALTAARTPQPVTSNGGTATFGLPRNATTYGAGDAGTTHTTYNVVINYLSENNEVLADPYTASLAAGSSFSVTVTFPTVQGYLPYVNEVQQNSIGLNYTDIDQDYTINVVYKPTNVNYTVIHYQQNVDNDRYTEVERETKQGLTGTTVPDVAKDYKGFYALLYEKPAIAADGSTVVEVYYDRSYYLMNFNLDGGYGVEPIYARYGTTISVGKPTKAGYTFNGWSPVVPEKMPVNGGTYTALWIVDDTAKVTVVFWGENPDDEGYSYIKSAEINVKPGTEFTYSEDGTLICALKEHTHTLAECYELTCTQEAHTHSESCYTCGQSSHTHDINCYSDVGNSSYAGLGAPSNPSNGYVARAAGSSNGKVIYINGTWYKYSGSTKTGSIAPTTCGKTEGTHTHTDSCLGCGKTEHTHSVENGCYELTCDKAAHTHTSDCYMNGAGLDSNLWKFVKSDTVTVAADGSTVVNVYYDRTTFTLTFKDGNQTVYTITEKWGADISEHWPIKGNNGTTYDSGERWQPSGSKTYSEVLVYISIMPAESFTLTVNNANRDTYVMHYMVEVLPGETGSAFNGKTFKESFKVSAKYNYVTEAEDFFDLDGYTQYGSSPSFRNGEIDIDGGGDVYFYYTRNSYTLTFSDGYNEVKSEFVLYEAPLSTYSSYVPDVPSAYEPGSVAFGGWYLNPECSGEEYKLNEHTMPADNLLLYAKWVPVSHTVKFYLDRTAWEAGTQMAGSIEVPHGSLADPTPKDPTNGNYKFVGWFYLDNGVEKAFDFANMPVTKDMEVYGKWSSDQLMPYYVYYKTLGADGEEIEIAAATTGSALAGTTKTFEAKVGTELIDGYQDGYFPVTKSHSMKVDIDATTENPNAYTFWYKQAEAVPYSVRYVTADVKHAMEGGDTITVDGVTYYEVASPKTVSDNHKAVVTETFVTVSGMMPDAYQKRLVVSVDENGDPDTENNVIIFFYTEDTIHAYYKITHYTENLGKDTSDNPTWTEYASSQIVGDIGTTYTAESMTIDGFTYDSTVEETVASGELTANGLELKLYYTRNSYPYQVRYQEQGTGNPLAGPKDGTGKYGQVISESPINIPGYTPVDSGAQTLNIKIETPDNVAALNIITFYYKENEATITYQVVGPDGCGSVYLTEETLKVISGNPQGSLPQVNTNFRFVGWYTDEACTTPVDSSWVVNGELTPQKGTSGVWTDVTYYAKFEYNVADLTISKSGCQDIDENQSFIFTVRGDSNDSQTSGISLTVVINGNGSVTIKDLPIGTYTVTEDGNWSWRYTASPAPATVAVTANGGAVTIANTRTGLYWLSGDSVNENQFDLNLNAQS